MTTYEFETYACTKETLKETLEKYGNDLLTEEGLNQALNEAGQVQGAEGALKMLGFGANALKTEDAQTQEIIGELIAEAEANPYITLPLIKFESILNGFFIEHSLSWIIIILSGLISL